ncbi:MAG: glycosyltransferase family 2 protein [Cyclobacteriaceae bacterium]
MLELSASRLTGIVIVNWNTHDITLQCIRSLINNIPKEVQIILVDNASEDGSGDLLHNKFPFVHYLKNKSNLGFTGGNNVGIRYCLSLGMDYVMLLNSDTLADHDFISPMLQYLDQHKEVGAIQPLIYFLHDKELVWNAGTWFSPTLGITWTIGEGKKDRFVYHQIREVPWLSGCCFLVRAQVLKASGLLDERFFMYYEDVDLSFKIRKLGHQLVYFPSVNIKHIAGASQKASNTSGEGDLSPNFHYLNIRNQLYVLFAHTEWFHRIISLPLLFVKISLFCIYFVVRLRFAKLRNLLKGLRDGLEHRTPG